MSLKRVLFQCAHIKFQEVDKIHHIFHSINVKRKKNKFWTPHLYRCSYSFVNVIQTSAVSHFYPLPLGGLWP